MRKKLKVGFLSFYYPHLGGSGVLATRIAKYLTEKGHEAHFIGYDTDSNPEFLENKGIKLHKVNKVDYPCLKNEPYVWTMANKVCEVVKKEKLDIIHAHYAIPHALIAYIAREQLKQEGINIPYIITGHGSDIHTNGKKEDVKSILQLALNKANAVTYVSKNLKNIAEKELGVSKKGRHITNFIDTDHFFPGKTNLRQKYKIPKKALVIGHVSNFAPIKQTYHFLDLAKSLRKKGNLRLIHFLMCGDGNEKEKLEAEIRKEGLSNYFTFTGRLNQKEVKSVYNAMDVLMICSSREGCPLVVLEAMSCETPVIGTRANGIKDLIQNGKNGFLFKIDDIKKLTEIVENLKVNKQLIEEMGKTGRAQMVKRHSVESVMRKYYLLYLRLLKEI